MPSCYGCHHSQQSTATVNRLNYPAADASGNNRPHVGLFQSLHDCGCRFEIGVDIADGPLVLDFLVIDRATSPGLEWNVIYWFAVYMQGMARRWYTGLGGVTFSHENGWMFDVTLRLAWSVSVRGG